MEIKSFSCPSCGANIDINQKKCDYCGNSVYINKFDKKYSFSELLKRVSSYNSVLSINPNDPDACFSLGICKLQQGLYDEAINLFERNILFSAGDANTFFYYAIALLKGKKPFLVARNEIDKIEELLKNAIAIDEKGIYYYFHGYVRYDHHERKGYRMVDKSIEYINQAKELGVTLDEIYNLHSVLNTKIPSELENLFI